MTSWALVVGINEYPERSKLSKLFGAVADAADFADWVLDPAGGNVQPDHLYFWTHPAPVTMGGHLQQFMQNPTPWPLVGPDFGKAPEANEIMHCVQKFAEKSVQEGAQRLYVFFAGHGAQTLPDGYAEDAQNCFMAGDFLAEMQQVGLVSCDDLKRFLARIGPAELILFFDCCRNTLPLKVMRPASVYSRTTDLRLHRRLGLGRAAQDEHVAFEVPIGHPTPTRGAFSQLLVGALRNHRVNGQLTFNQLDAYVTAGMADLVRPAVQVPDFTEKPKPPAIVLVAGQGGQGIADLRLTFSIVPPGTSFLVVDAEANTVAADIVAAGGHDYTLPIGIYSVELQDGSVLKMFHLQGPGQTHVEI